MKILNFGSCNVDYVYSMDHIVQKGETQSTAGLQLFAGGKGLNQSIAIARSGHRVFHAGCIGEGGEFLLELLRENGVDVTYITRVAEKNGHAIIQVGADGDNAIFLYPGSNETITEAQMDAVLSNFESGDILLLQNEINDIDRIIEKAHGKDMTVILNPSPYNERIATLDLGKISCLILNEIEAREITKSDTVQGVMAYFYMHYPHLKIMLTLGEAGCVYHAEGREIFCPAYRAKAVDTTGAGDTFTGYFIGGLSDGLEMERVLQLATCAAAISVTREGAAASVPSVEEVKKVLRKGDGTI